jgi:hypothetical protein
MQYSYEEIQKFSTWDYIKNWLFFKGIKSKINILFILSLIHFSIFTWIKKKKSSLDLYILIDKKHIGTDFFCAIQIFYRCIFRDFLFFSMNILIKKICCCFFCFQYFLFQYYLFPLLFNNIFQVSIGNFMAGFEKEQFYKPSTYEYHQFKSLNWKFKFNVSKNYPYNFETPLPAISESFIFDDVKAGIFLNLLIKITF